MQLHLDPLGGMAGDMFVAAVLDAFPQHEAGVLAAVAATARDVRCGLVPHNDGVLQGRRFSVELASAAAHPTLLQHTHEPHHHGHDHHHPHNRDGEPRSSESQSEAPLHHGEHGHRHWSDIRRGLAQSDLPEPVRSRAIDIFSHLAEVEARVHGISVEDVAFHEVGAWDSIADIVAAAHLIEALGAERWTVGVLPLGSGRVRTAHGLLPVPAPATALLLQGFATVDDGVPGERVTPTGAAILRHLCPNGSQPASGPRTLGRSGVGFGTKHLPGMSNCLRVLVFDEVGASSSAGHRELAVIEFEVDDQSAEDLAMGLDRLRAHPDIFDAVQMPVFGKKGRMMTHVRLLARANASAEAIAACFRETTTIGLRHHVVSGAALERRISTVEVAGRAVRVKTVDRPGGRTAKAEADDALSHETHAARAELRREAERAALFEASR